MKTKYFVLAAALVLTVCSVARADISVTWGTSWDNPADPAWGLSSGDAALISGAGNYGYDYIAYYLMKQGYSTNFADCVTEARYNYFKGDVFSLGPVVNGKATMLNEFAGYRDGNQFGWYAIDGSSTGTIFPGSAGRGDTATASIPVDFGLYLKVANTNTTWYSDVGLNGADGPHVLFYPLETDAFNHTTKWLAAWEDLSLGNSDKDYQDMILTLEGPSKPVPEPISSTLFLLGAGALGTRLFRNRKKG